MNTRAICVLALVLLSAGARGDPLMMSVDAPGDEHEESYGFLGGRSEIWLGISAWPALADLSPVANGEFDTAGLALGGAIHWPVARFANSDLLVGGDLFFGATGSNIRGFIGDLYARQMYLGGSLKWAFGERRNLFLDAGLGYYLVDIAQLSDSIYGPEEEAWEESSGGTYVGMTWDVGAGREHRTAGLTLSLKVHFFDLGTVRNESLFGQDLLGTNAGQLDGPLYMLQVGFGGR